MRAKEIQVIYAWIYLLLFCLIENILYSFEVENYHATQFREICENEYGTGSLSAQWQTLHKL